MTIASPTRRTILGAAATAPAALAVPSIGQAEPEDPVVAAVLAFAGASEAERTYRPASKVDWEDDAQAVALPAAVDRTY